MKAEVIAIGSELLLGQIVDTNSAFIARRLAEVGIEMVQTKTVGDDLGRIEETIKNSINRSEIVITTGGIGPTEDDLTREAIANVTHHPLAFQPRLMEQIEAIIQRRGFRMSAEQSGAGLYPRGGHSHRKSERNGSRFYCGRVVMGDNDSARGFPLRWNTCSKTQSSPICGNDSTWIARSSDTRSFEPVDWAKAPWACRSRI